MDSVERKLVRGWEAKPDTPSLAIGYVCNGWTVTMQLCYSLHNFVMYDWGPDGRHALKRMMSVGGLYIDDNRNKLTSFFLENKNLQWLLMVDSDIEFTYHTIYQLLDAADPVERPVVSALYFSNFTDDKLGVQPLWYFEKEKNQFSHFLEPICLEGGNVLHKIDACGAGCMLVHRSVFERIAELHKDENYKWFKHLEVSPDTTPVGEDLVFPVDGTTPVLGADWQWRSIGDYKIGDEVLGFEEQITRYVGRRFKKAIVEDIVERRLPRVRLITEESEIVTTLEHPWLSNKGKSYDNKRAWQWRSVAELEPGMVLTSIIEPVINPDLSDPEYMRGYILGMLHSDGARQYGNENHSKFGFTVRMKDTEPLERLATFFALLGVRSVRGRARWDGNLKHAPMHKLGVYHQDDGKYLELIHKSEPDSVNAAAGYLAGMYDGDGCCSNGTLCITSRRDHYKDRLQGAAALLNIHFPSRDDEGIYMFDRRGMFDFFQKALPAMSRRMFPLGNHSSKLGKRVIHRPVRIAAIERLDSGDVRCLRTSSSTFIAGGFASHNCQRIREAGFPIYGLGLVVQHCKMGRVNEHVYLKDHPDYMQNISVDELGDRVKLKRVA